MLKQMKKGIFCTVIFCGCLLLPACSRNQTPNIGIIGGADGPTSVFITSSKPSAPKTPASQIPAARTPTPKALNIPRIVSTSDKDQDGLNDTDDILEGARKDAENKPIYRDGYYIGGYPPDDEGVCTDVIWRAFKNAGYMLKEMVDEDIQNNLDLYSRVEGKPDPNIDFRRIKNLRSFFDRHAVSLTTEIIPGDEDNLKQWQAGDIVVFDDPHEHIGILSDRRNQEGIPLIIHNSGPYTQENDMLLYWRDNLSPIIGHYRFPPEGSAENEGKS
jgi:uncharacterized protein YijF (DUF1287 family)